MQNFKPLKMLWISSFIALSSCENLPVYNTRVYVDLGPSGSHYAETLTNATGDIPKTGWDQLRVGMLCMSSESFNDIETEIDQACQLVTCTYQTRESLRLAFNRIRPLVRK